MIVPARYCCLATVLFPLAKCDLLRLEDIMFNSRSFFFNISITEVLNVCQSLICRCGLKFICECVRNAAAVQFLS